MYDYLAGLFVLIIMILFSFMLGTAIRKKVHFARNTITGYLIYSFFVSLFFIPIQLFKLSWYFALIIFILIIITLLSYIIYIFNKERNLIVEIKNYPFLKNYWLLFVIVGILIVLSVLNVGLYWLNNHLDDGYYLTKITTLPYLENPFSFNYAVGLEIQNGSFDTYLLNTWELETSIIVFLLKIDGVIFTRLYLSSFNYLLYALSVYTISEMIFSSISDNFRQIYLQSSALILILFTFNMEAMANLNIITLQDSWQFNTAMYYGSMFVRTIGIILYFLYFIDLNEVKIIDYLSIFGITIVLISKSTVVLPISILCSISIYFMLYWINKKHSKKMLFPVILIILFSVISIFVSNHAEMENIVLTNVIDNLFSIWGLFCIMMFMLSLSFHSQLVNRINCAVIMIFLFILIPNFNDGFELLSQYNFVAMRSLSSLYYFIIILAYIYFIVFLHERIKKEAIIKSILCLSFIALTFSSLYLNDYKVGPICHELNTLKNNKKLMPESTILLAKKLESLSMENDVNVMMPSMIYANEYLTSLSVIIRNYAPHIVSISALSRYPINDGSLYSEFTIEDQIQFESFLNVQSKDNYHNVSALFEKYKVNYFVVLNGNSDDIYNFKWVDTVIDENNEISYSIYRVQ